MFYQSSGPDSTGLSDVNPVDRSRALDIIHKLVGGLMGCLGQRLSVIWTEKCIGLSKTVKGS